MTHRRLPLPTRRPRAARTAAAVAGLAAAVLAPVLAPVAHAAVSPADEQPVIDVVKKDRWFDLQTEGGRLRAVPPARRKATDLRAVAFQVDRRAGQEKVRVTWSVRDLTRVRGTQIFALLAQPEGVEPWEGTVAFLDVASRDVLVFGPDDFRRCGRATTVLRWEREQVVATLPTACLGSLEAAQLQGAAISVPARRGPAVFDQAPRTRLLPLTTYVEQSTDGSTDGTTGAPAARSTAGPSGTVDPSRLVALARRAAAELAG